MNYGYVVRIGKCFFRFGDENAEITKNLWGARLFTKKKDALETANRYGGRTMEVKLTDVEGDSK